MCARVTRDPVSGFRVGIAFNMAKAVLEYFVRRVVTNSLEISFHRPLPTVLTTNRGNGHDNVTGL
jgi:hypothetical protein